MKKRKSQVVRTRRPTADDPDSAASVDWDRLLSDVRGLKLLTHLQLQLIRNLERTADAARSGACEAELP